MLSNNQPREKQSFDPEGCLDVFNIFHTIQGEGPFAGSPAVFVRLAGCNLQCPFCDTDYTSKREKMSVSSILQKIKEAGTAKIVVITGGEPLRQYVAPLCLSLLESGYIPQIETNGTYYQDLPDGTVVVCSPKTPRLASGVSSMVTHWKYVMEADHVGADGLPLEALGGNMPARPNNDAPIYLQPMDDGDELFAGENWRNLTAVRKSCMQHGYILCLQIHKIIGLD